MGTLAALKNISLLFCLLLVVLVLNHEVILFDMMYPEQPSIYLINQSIVHLSDLLNIYIHPKLLHEDIPFFRPSGHFLIYQLITPLLGWHNTKAFIIINFTFLTLIGFFMIKLYQFIFPNYRMGGYVAFSIYLMHPALTISRLTIMHFEFAYVFFLIVSLYLFILFCHKSTSQSKNQLDEYFLLISSLLLYVVAVTFKEPAVMLGPVLMIYFWIERYDQQQLLSFFQHMMMNKKNRYVIVLVTAFSVSLGIYLLASWPALDYASKNVSVSHTLGTVNAFLKDVFGLSHDYIISGSLASPELAWRTIVFPLAARLIIGSLCWILLVSTILIFMCSSHELIIYKKSLIFLYLSALIFLILPFSWAMGGPWHYSLTILCLGLAMGFSIEYWSHILIKSKRGVFLSCGIIAVVIASMTICVNKDNINKYKVMEEGAFGITLNRNAVFYPPNIKSKLNSDSIIVVEDSILRNDYFMGNAAYPFLLFLGNAEYDILQRRQSAFFLKFHHTYSGTLFRYAYLMPTLKEEVYPFKIDKMHDVPNEIIYNWLQHFDNIFCLGYDENANWHDKTVLFKQYLLKEQSDRQLDINQYQSFPVVSSNQHLSYTQSLTIPDKQLCQYTCDQDQNCEGFIYQYDQSHHHAMMQCQFSSSAFSANHQLCHHCEWFKKLHSLSGKKIF
ncbi:MAG: hypothetical protein KIT56_04480 [Gammaproteobacteria bacterium]|nr:hypothetical protein [Gammaproteobacteria bacterium]MCW5583134.1 hypothetical protein [Gammaproteobacteria bacterium]